MVIQPGAWIESESTYCVRGDPRRAGAVGLRSEFLRSEFLVLYGEGRDPTLWRLGEELELLTGGELLERGYPGPRGTKYIGLALAESLDWSASGLAEGDINGIAARLSPTRGAPTWLTWAKLLRDLSTPSGSR